MLVPAHGHEINFVGKAHVLWFSFLHNCFQNSLEVEVDESVNL